MWALRLPIVGNEDMTLHVGSGGCGAIEDSTSLTSGGPSFPLGFALAGVLVVTGWNIFETLWSQNRRKKSICSLENGDWFLDRETGTGSLRQCMTYRAAARGTARGTASGGACD
jgi:hypothetical protein